MKISFHGADRSVTGSCHMIECAGRKLLIDCGLYQGERELHEDNAEPFRFDPKTIDFLLLTHAHLDHCGRIPLLSKRGFRGEIITTSATRELARLVMLDAAHLQEEEARIENRHRARRGHEGPEIEPLYSVLDAMNSTEHFGRSATYNERLELAPGIVVTFIEAGHILGSACVFLELLEGDKKRTVLFSGDLGNAQRPFLRSPATPPPADVVVMETTYGDRLHKALSPSVDELYEAINDTVKRGGNVIIPTFALERAQEILFCLQQGSEQQKLPRSMQVFVDSPMAISATEIFEHHPECYQPTVKELFAEGRDPFKPLNSHITRETSESIAINRITGGAVILAGSGMCTGGRVRHHLQHNLWRRESSIIFVGYAAHGTLARRIIDGARSVRIYGQEVQVKAAVHTISGFSAHADQAELLSWHRQTGQPEKTFLVHGDEEVMRTFASLLTNTQVELPALGDQFDLV